VHRLLKFLWISSLFILPGALAFGDQVTNGGFETGDFTGWNLSGNTSCMGVVPAGSNSFIAGAICGGLNGSIVHSGTYSAYLGPNTEGVLSQTLATVPGTTYDINFWLASTSLGGVNTPNDFSVTFGGTTLASSTNLSPFSFTDFDYQAVATAPSTALSFSERNGFAYFVLDDVSVNPVAAAVPEPGMMGVTGILFGLALVAVSRIKRAALRRDYDGRAGSPEARAKDGARP